MCVHVLSSYQSILCRLWCFYELPQLLTLLCLYSTSCHAILGYCVCTSYNSTLSSVFVRVCIATYATVFVRVGIPSQALCWYELQYHLTLCVFTSYNSALRFCVCTSYNGILRSVFVRVGIASQALCMLELQQHLALLCFYELPQHLSYELPQNLTLLCLQCYHIVLPSVF